MHTITSLVPNKLLRPYIVRNKHVDEYAVLVFAHDNNEARKVGCGLLQGLDDTHFHDVRACLSSKDSAEYLLTQADPVKLGQGIAHGNDNPESCSNCETWGHPLHRPRMWCQSCLKDFNAEFEVTSQRMIEVAVQWWVRNFDPEYQAPSRFSDGFAFKLAELLTDWFLDDSNIWIRIEADYKPKGILRDAVEHARPVDYFKNPFPLKSSLIIDRRFGTVMSRSEYYDFEQNEWAHRPHRTRTERD